ncbi:MAG: thrombospondin type 3 repeat-containing protein, partial [Nitrosopumilus sp.]|nr:thrombospondin type 3 repeat-containing protein [Nitrosopumilus sp.]MDH3517233.1 thrombospondin type 3 repeat-containing protein [Nitrosopumilus sp.]
MKKQYLLGFLILLTTTIGMFPSGVYANEAIDSDGDGVPNNLDYCPHLLEDYDPQYGNNIDGCPADFVPWYDADYDGIQDHIDNCPTVKETYNRFQDEDG